MTELFWETGYFLFAAGTAPTPLSYRPPCCFHTSNKSLWVAGMLATQSKSGFFSMLFYPTFLFMSFLASSSCCSRHFANVATSDWQNVKRRVFLYIKSSKITTPRKDNLPSIDEDFFSMLSQLIVAVKSHLFTLHSVPLQNSGWDCRQSEETHWQMVL